MYNKIRLLAVDGSDVHVSTDKIGKNSFYPRVNHQKQYNLLHLNTLYDICNNIYTDAIIQKSRKANEYKVFVSMAYRLDSAAHAILMGDRVYESFNNLAHIQEKEPNFLIRIKDINSVGLLNGLNLPDKMNLTCHLICL